MSSWMYSLFSALNEHEQFKRDEGQRLEDRSYQRERRDLDLKGARQDLDFSRRREGRAAAAEGRAAEQADYQRKTRETPDDVKARRKQATRKAALDIESAAADVATKNYNAAVRLPAAEAQTAMREEKEAERIRRNRKLTEEGLAHGLKMYFAFGEDPKALERAYNEVGKGRVKEGSVQHHIGPDGEPTGLVVFELEDGTRQVINPKIVATDLGAYDPSRDEGDWRATGGGAAAIDQKTGEMRAAPDEVQEAIRGTKAASGSTSAKLQETEALYSRMPPIEGETDDQRWMRAFDTANRTKAKDDFALTTEFYKMALQKHLDLAESEIHPARRKELMEGAEKRAEAMTNRYIEKYVRPSRRQEQGSAPSGDPLGILGGSGDDPLGIRTRAPGAPRGTTAAPAIGPGTP